MTYLTAWQSAIPKAQSDWIEQLVHGIDQESVLSEDQIKEQLNRLTKLLAAGDTRTLTQLFLAIVSTLIDAEAFNLMLDGLTGDLIAAFDESMNLGELHDTYQKLYEQRIITELRTALGKLEADAQRLTYLGNNTLGFSQSLGSNFSIRSFRTPRTHALADLLYRDPRLNRRATTSQECVVDDRARALTLPLLSNRTHQIERISLITKDLANGLGGSELPNTRLENLIDQKENTYWIYQEAATSPAPDGLQVQVQLDLMGFEPFSIIEVQPVADYPFKLSELTYENTLGQSVDLLSQMSSEVQQDSISRPLRLHFNECQGRRLYLGFTQESYQQVLNSSLQPAATPPAWPQDATPPTPAPAEDSELCLYTMGFDNILVGQAVYQDMGIYVSPMLEVEKCVLVGLSVKEDIPSRFGSVEYYVMKRDLDANGNALQTRVVPMLPLEQRQVTGETLCLVSSQGNYVNDTGQSRFCAHRNGTALDLQIYEEDRVITDLEYRLLDDLTSQNPSRIQLLNPGGNLFYSIDYTPAHLTTMAAYYLNDTQELWFSGSNALHCALTVNGRDVSRSQLFLLILLRHNSRWPSLTPQVHQYQLMAASGA